MMISRFDQVILVVLVLAMVQGCRFDKGVLSVEPDISDYNWGTRQAVIIEGGYFHSEKYLDTTDYQLRGDTLIPLEYLPDNRLVITRLLPSKMEMRETENHTEFVTVEAEYVRDTFSYDVRNWIGKSFLILYSREAASMVYELKNDDPQITETTHLDQPVYNISGYHVGSAVNRDEVDVVFTDNFGTSVIEEAHLIDDPRILFTLVGRKYIEQIQYFNIDEKEMNAIKKDLNKIFSREPEYEELINGEGPGREVIQGYYWNEKEVSISLQRTRIEDQPDPGWTMTYSNYIVTSILQNYLNDPGDQP